MKTMEPNERALLRYYVAATRGDLTALCAVLEEARGDAVLQREILALDEALVADTPQGGAASQETPRRAAPRRRPAARMGLAASEPAAAEPGIKYGSAASATPPPRRPRKKKP